MADRYGEPPSPIRNLLDATALKLLGQKVGVAGIDRKQNIFFVGPGTQPKDMEDVNEVRQLGQKLVQSLLANNP